MRKTYQFRLNPTRSQRSLLNHTLELCRWVYNETLATRKNTWEQEQKNAVAVRYQQTAHYLEER